MFTGLIQMMGTIRHAERSGDGLRVGVACAKGAFPIARGDSIACDGICLTVTHFDDTGFDADLSHETLACTAAGAWKAGTIINLEPSLRVGDSIGGHFVSGHIDGVGSIANITKRDEAFDITVTLPTALAAYVAVKGSIAVNGISLTVNNVSADAFSVTIIPHTMLHTNLQHAKAGDAVNLEVDILARYTVRALEARA